MQDKLSEKYIQQKARMEIDQNLENYEDARKLWHEEDEKSGITIYYGF